MVTVVTAADVGRGRLPTDVIARVKQTPVYDVCQTYVRPRRSKCDLISEHTLISEHPPHFVLVKTIARANRDLCVLAVLLCCIMQTIFDAN